MSGKKSKSVDFDYLNDKRIEKGKNKLLDDAKQWKGGSHKERREEKEEIRASAQRAAKKHSKHSVEKVSWKKKALGIGGIFFIAGVGLFQFLGTVGSFIMGTGMKDIDVSDSATMKSVLFGGDPWFIYCINNQTQNDKLPRVLEESASTLKSNLGVRTGILRCWDKMESGRTVAQRFNLKLNPPLSFLVANGNKPKIVTLVGVSKPEDLERRIKPLVGVEVSRIDSLKKWPSLCTSRRSCILIGHKQAAQLTTAMNLVKPFVDKHRGTRFVSVDTSFWQIKFDPTFIRTRPGAGGGNRGADVLCLSRNEQNDGNRSHSGLFLERLTTDSVTKLIQACESRTGLLPLKDAPKIVARKSKPKKVTPPSYRPSPRPTPPPKKDRRTNVDRVGSRVEMERQAQDDALFEAVDESDAEEESDEEADEADMPSGEDREGAEENEDEEEVEL